MEMKLPEIIEALQRGERQSTENYLRLYSEADFHALCGVADDIRHRMHGRKVYYIINRHINYTNICTCRCPVCTFGVENGSSGAYAMSIKQITEIAAKSAGVREFHVVGGLNPELPYDYYMDVVRTLKTIVPAASIKAFTAVEIDFIAKIAGKTAAVVLEALKAAGLDALPGGGAEIFSARYRQEYFPNKISGPRWLEIHQIAHRLGLWTTATMLYGTGESEADRVEHLIALRATQDRSMKHYGVGFMCFVPLAYRAANNGGAGTVCDMRTIAISRVILDNIEHVKAFAPILGEGAAEAALCCGADDIDAVPDDYAIVEQRATGGLEKLLNSIRGAGFETVERDSFYNGVRQ